MAEMYTSDNILKRMLEYTEPGYDKSAGGFIYDSQAPVADELAAYHTEIENKNDRHFLDTAYGEDVDRYVGDYGMERKKAEKAIGECTFIGSPGSTIKVGDRVADVNGLIFYVTQAGVVGDNGEVTLPIECASATANGNCEIGEINQMPVTIRGIIQVTNRKATGGGASTETDNELKERFRNRMKHKYVPGSAPWYEAEAESVDGVPNGGAKCVPTWNGGGTVKLIVLNSDFQPAEDVLLDKVRNHFIPPIVGAILTVVTAAPMRINISVDVETAPDSDLEKIKSDFSEKVKEYFKTFKNDGGTIVIKYIGNLLFSVEGVEDYDNLKLNGQDSNIVISESSEQIPVLGGVTFG